MAKKELEANLEQYELYLKQNDQLEVEIEELAFQVPGVKEMVSMKGVGIMTWVKCAQIIYKIIGLMAESGNLSSVIILFRGIAQTCQVIYTKTHLKKLLNDNVVKNKCFFTLLILRLLTIYKH